jgi:heat shock protein HslJ
MASGHGQNYWVTGLALLAACAGGAAQPAHAPAAEPLAGTSWTLVEFRSSDDAIGRIRPDDPNKYTMTLGADGRVAMNLNCNRGTGSWSATPTNAESGQFSLGPLAMTRALCPPSSMDERIARDAEFVRSYVRMGDQLFLSLMADGGIYIWREVKQ